MLQEVQSVGSDISGPPNIGHSSFEDMMADAEKHVRFADMVMLTLRGPEDFYNKYLGKVLHTITILMMNYVPDVPKVIHLACQQWPIQESVNIRLQVATTELKNDRVKSSQV